MPTVMISAGEASGDKHGAEIAKLLIKDEVHCVGMGSKSMQAAGVELFVDSASIAVVGIVEVLAHWSEIQNALKTLKKKIIESPPDLLVLIDYQEFNFKLARFAKQHNVKVLFYVSPQVWAWRSGRVKKIGQYVDMMAVIFPFEVPFYEKAHIPVRYVGHPLTNKVIPKLGRESALQKFSLDADKKTIALLPGSRVSEIKRILPILLTAAELIKKELSETQFILPLAATINPNLITDYLSNEKLSVKVVQSDHYDVINCSDAVIVASGTATLEVALLAKPMVIVYKVSTLSYAILKRMIKVKYVGLANIVAGEEVVPEMIQSSAEPSRIAAETIKQISDKTYRNNMINKLSIVKKNLGELDGVKALVSLISNMLYTTKV